MDLANDPRFREIPAHLQKALEAYEYTGEGGGTPYQEVQFELDGLMVQTAVLERKYTALPADQVDRLGSIIKVWQKKDLMR